MPSGIHESSNLRESAVRLITGAIPHIVWVFDARGSVVQVNRRCQEFFGVGEQELAGDGWRSFLHPEDLDEFTSAWWICLSARRVFRHRGRFRHADGGWRWLSCHIQPLIEGGQLQGWLGTCTDLTEQQEEAPILGESRVLRQRPGLQGDDEQRRLAEHETGRRKVAEEQLRRSHETFYNLIQNSPLGVYIIDADFRLVQVSLGAQKVFENVRPLLGRDYAEVLRTIWAEPFASEAIARFRHTLATGEPYHSPNTTESRNDVQVVESYDWQIERVMLPDGRYGVVCYFYDLSERTRLERALRESEERFRVMADGIAHMIWACDPEGDILFVNKAYQDFFGVGEEVIGGDRWVPLVHPEDAEQYVNEFLACTRERRPFHANARVRRHDGQWRWIESYGTPRFSPDGEYMGIVGSSPDVTARRDAQEALARANGELQRFVSIASHDLKEPLRGVAHLASFVLEDEPALGEESRARLLRVQSLCERLTAMINGLLQYARSGGERRSEPCDLGEIARRAVDKLDEMLRAERVEVMIDPGLPTMSGDPTLLERVFANLVANAIHYNQSAIKRIHIGMEGDSVFVQDNGIGIDSRHHERVFSLFSRLAADHDAEGVGLGLALVKNIVESHGGTITVRSAPGEGSTFLIRFPILDTAGA